MPLQLFCGNFLSCNDGFGLVKQSVCCWRSLLLSEATSVTKVTRYKRRRFTFTIPQSDSVQLQFSRWLTRVSLLICLRGDGCSLQLQQGMLGNGNNDFTGCNLDEASLVVLLFTSLTRAENF